MTENSNPYIAELAANLQARSRLGLPVVKGSHEDLDALLSKLAGRPQSGGLETIRRNMGQCVKCELHRERKKIVFGVGPDDAQLMFIGEAPGAQEDRQGEPFVGPAGKLLDRMLAAVGLRREQVYIANIVKCRPPQNRDPRPEEAAACRQYLNAQIKAIAPKVICTLGRPAAQALLNTDAPISALRGKWQKLGEIPVLPTFHPAFLLRQAGRKAEAYRDMKALIRALRTGPPPEV